MLLYVYDRDMTLLGVAEKITSLMWTRRYWSVGEFKLLLPFTPKHGEIFRKNNLIIKQGENSAAAEAAEILYINIRKDKTGAEEIEVQGKFISHWLGKRILLNQIITTDTTPNILKKIVTETITNPKDPDRKIPGVELGEDTGIERGQIEYTSEPYTDALLATETAAKASKIGFRMRTNIKEKKHYFEVYDGRDLTADQKENRHCIFSQEFDNVGEQEYTNSVENLKSTAYVGGEEKEGAARKVVEVGETAAGLERQEVFINATDITQTYTEGETEHTMTDEQYIEMLKQRGAQELENYAETLNFSSNIDTFGNLKYREDYDIGDRVTCINKNWKIKINVRITEVTEVYQQGEENLEITFGESLPALLDKIRQVMK